MISINARAFQLMATSRAMSDLYEKKRQICKYVHSTSRGHEAIQIAAGIQLLNCDFVSPYYRDDSLMLAMGFQPYEMMLQLLAKADDPFSGGRSYYCHPSSRASDKPTIIHQSSATGMQAIPATGIAQGIQYLEFFHSALLRKGTEGQSPAVVCSLGDDSITEGEVSEAFQFAVLKQLPILFLIQDNQWGISAAATETRTMNAFEYADGFKGMHKLQVDGSDFEASFEIVHQALEYVRLKRKPVLVHASVPLLAHHTSGVRKEFYRSAEDLENHLRRDPYLKLKTLLLQQGYSERELDKFENEAQILVEESFNRAVLAAEPDPETIEQYVFAPTPDNKGNGRPSTGIRSKGING